MKDITPRQLEVIIHLSTYGGSNKEIARDLGIAEQTVKEHVREALQRLGLHSRASLVIWAYTRGPLACRHELTATWTADVPYTWNVA